MENKYIEKQTCYNCVHWDANDFFESICTLTNEPSQNCVCEKYKCIFDAREESADE